MDFRFPFDVPGWLSEAEGRKLYELAAGRLVLEIGSYLGRSTVCLAQSAKRFVAIDHHRGDAGTGPGWTLPGFLETLDRYGVRDKVIPVVGRTWDVGPFLTERMFGLVFVDGAHDEDNVSVDVAIAIHTVRAGGVIALHDWHEVGPFVGETLGEPAGVVDSLAWFDVPSSGRAATPETCP